MTHDEQARELYYKEKGECPIPEYHFYGANYYCPECKDSLNYKYPITNIHYCAKCGQKIDWSFLDKGG